MLANSRPRFGLELGSQSCVKKPKNAPETPGFTARRLHTLKRDVVRDAGVRNMFGVLELRKQKL